MRQSIFLIKIRLVALAARAQQLSKQESGHPAPAQPHALQAGRRRLAASISRAADAAQFDSEALWAAGAARRSARATRVLIVRGTEAGADQQGTGRDWLAQQIALQGRRGDFVVAYHRGAARWTEAQRTQARAAASDGAIWLFSSSEALANLARCSARPGLGPGRAPWPPTRASRKPRAQLGFASVHECRPRWPMSRPR